MFLNTLQRRSTFGSSAPDARVGHTIIKPLLAMAPKAAKTVSFYGAEHLGTAGELLLRDPSVPWVETSIARELATPSTMIQAAPQTRVATPLSTVVRTSDMQPGQILTGHVVDLQTGERRSAHDADKRMYLMPWGEALIGVDPATRKKLDFACALAWEYDVAFVRSMRTSIDAEGLIGSLGRHPLTPPLDYGRLERFERSQVMGLLKTPLKHFSIASIVALDPCSRKHYVRIKRDTDNVVGHSLRLHCASCGICVLKDGMQCCRQCKFHMPVCSTECFKLYWTRTHKAVCVRHKLVKSYARGKTQ
jgi:hypothetical protein